MKENGKIKVQVGSVLHPMLPEHYIQWIALVSGNKVEFRFLKPGEEPKAELMKWNPEKCMNTAISTELLEKEL